MLLYICFFGHFLLNDSGDLLFQAGLSTTLSLNCEREDSTLAHVPFCVQQTVLLTTMFFAIISYVLGIAMETLIPARGFLRYLNPVYYFPASLPQPY